MSQIGKYVYDTILSCCFKNIIHLLNKMLMNYTELMSANHSIVTDSRPAESINWPHLDRQYSDIRIAGLSLITTLGVYISIQ